MSQNSSGFVRTLGRKTIVPMRPTDDVPRIGAAAQPFTIPYDKSVQTLEALRAAAYRLIGRASIRIQDEGSQYLCHVEPTPNTGLDSGAVKRALQDIVNDENLRASLAQETADIRKAILSLAFGSAYRTSERGGEARGEIDGR